MQDLLLDRIIWFLRNVDLTQRPRRRRGALSRRHRCRRGGARQRVVRRRRWRARGARRQELMQRACPTIWRPHGQSRPAHGRARHRAGRRPHRQGASAKSPPPISPPARSSGSTVSPVRRSNIPIADYFDRLALDRARDSIGDAERRLDRRDGRQRRGRRAARSRPGWRRARTKSNESAARSTRSPVPA